MSGADDFDARRDAARLRINSLAGGKGGDGDVRRDWFDAVYRNAGDDAAAVPWADLHAKPVLTEWLSRHPGDGRTAIDVGCGLGDNAEALASAGYVTTGFDVSERAVAWARQRFPQSSVHYAAADLFAPPPAWLGAFDLVNEVYIVQALDGAMRRAAPAAMAALLAPGGRLLMTTRTRPENTAFDGPPWPLMPSEVAAFEQLGLEREEEATYDLPRGERMVPHLCVCFRKV